ncbi:MAG: hypothetical protein ACK4TO_04945 [Candidatus Nitrosotenuis sp.]
MWCPKYRKKILVGNVAVFVQAQIRQIAIDQRCDICHALIM